MFPVLVFDVFPKRKIEYGLEIGCHCVTCIRGKW
jgi:hypothetical protein